MVALATTYAGALGCDRCPWAAASVVPGIQVVAPSPSWTHDRGVQIDHLVYAAADLDVATEQLERELGVRPAFGGRHPAFGTHNALLGLGGRAYLEALAPDPGAAQPATPGTFGLADENGSELLATWAIACDDIEAAVARARERGFDPGDPVPLERVDEHGNRLTWQLTLNFLAGGPMPFLISWGETRTRPSPRRPDSFWRTSSSSIRIPMRCTKVWRH